MKALINHHFDSKFSVYATRFLSSLVSLQTPLILPAKPRNPSKISTSFDPYQFFNEAAKSRNYTLQETKIIHTCFLKSSDFHSDAEFSNFLLRGYSKASAIVYALRVFDEIPQPDTSSWNLIVTCQNKNFKYDDSWKTFCRMHSSGFYPNEFTYGSVLSACIALNYVHHGKLLYALAFKHGFSLDGYVRTGIIDLFLKTSSFDDALRVFYDESCGNVVCWNAIISGAVKHNYDDIGLNLFQQMYHGSPPPNKFTFPSVFTACAKHEKLELGKAVHALVIKHNEEDIFVSTAIIDFYAKCGQVDEAVKKFSRMSVRNVVSWTAIITGYVQKSEFKSALELFKEMIILKEDINNYTVTIVLSACADPVMFKEALQIHSWIYKTRFYTDPTVKNSLINVYSKTGSMELAEQVFKDAKDLLNPSTWASMITAFSQNLVPEKAFSLLKRMLHEGLRPDISCIPSVLRITDRQELGEQIHSYVIKMGIFFNILVASSLFTMYSKCGSLNESYEIFKQIPDKDNVSWTSMITGFAEHGFAYQAIELFRDMVFNNIVLDQTTLTSVLAACSSSRFLKIGKEIHVFFIRRNDKHDDSPIVNMYSRCGHLEYAQRVFSMMRFKDEISCSSLISGYAQNGLVKEAIKLFCDLILLNLEVDSFILSSILRAVGEVNGSEIGTQLHARVLKLGFESEPSVGSSLVTMYSKCGTIDHCRKVFDQIDNPDLISWTAIISSLAQHGKGLEALEVYKLMMESGTKPDSVTFMGVLAACSHSGLVEEGFAHLGSMVRDYRLEPGQRHYACMVDGLGRAGRLEEAKRFIDEMPVEPDGLVWGALLAACKVHGAVEMGRVAAKKVMELEPWSDGGYVGLSNICADLGQWEEVVKIRSEMKGSGVKKEPGWSYV